MGDVMKISRDRERALALYEMAVELFGEIKKDKSSKPHRRVRDYYEIIVQLITGIMYADGFKTLSHVGLIEYVHKNKILNERDVRLVDSLRKLRHGIIYYGKKSGEEFLVNNEEDIISVIGLLRGILEKNLGK
jgi:hypothetical protein